MENHQAAESVPTFGVGHFPSYVHVPYALPHQVQAACDRLIEVFCPDMWIYSIVCEMHY